MITAELQTSDATRLVKGVQMIRLQKAVMAVGMFSIFEAILQDHLNCENEFIEIARILETSSDKILLQKFSDLATRGYVEFIPDQFKLLKQTGSVKSEMKIIRKDGLRVCCLINAVKLSDDRYLAFVKDITESKIAQENLSNNEKRFRALVEYNDGIITVLDKDLNTIFRSQSSVLITGYSDEEFEKIKSVDYYHPAYLQYVRETIQKSVDQPGIPVEISFQVKHKNGNYIWLQGILNNKISDSSVGGIIANLKDVTEFKNAHETLVKEKDKFAKIAETSPGLIYSMRQNKNGILSYSYASSAVMEIYGFTFKEIENLTKGGSKTPKKEPLTKKEEKARKKDNDDDWNNI